jgi:hypothetical protein
METDPISKTLDFKLFRNPDDGKSEIPRDSS